MRCFCGNSFFRSNTHNTQIYAGEVNCCSDFFGINISVFLDVNHFKNSMNNICITFSPNEIYFIHCDKFHNNTLFMHSLNNKQTYVKKFNIPQNLQDYYSIVIECFDYLKRVKCLESFK